ncbi:MAG: recombinase family protein, partial [Oscillospiraceae bacterium]|nr:recombinase family protein [Oscillospiraceae bacterium]
MARKSRRLTTTDSEQQSSTPTYATWGYARISIDGERSEDSIENQTAIIQDYVGSKDEFNLCGVITDLGFTGRDFDRPGYA